MDKPKVKEKQLILFNAKPDYKYTLIKKFVKNDRMLYKLKRSDGKIVFKPGIKFLKLKRRGLVIIPPPPVEYPKLPKHIRKAVPPKDFFGIRCGEDRVQIVSIMGEKDLLCWHGRLECNMHLLRKDLHPKGAVDNAIAFLKSIDTNETNRRETK